MTPFEVVYDAFFTLITDDMYLEISEEETKRDCQQLLMASLPLFEFPKKALTFTMGEEVGFDERLSLEEINILAMGMNQIWLQRQITSIEATRQKFSGPDFKLTSQASHLQRLMALITQIKTEHRHLQMLYSRRRVNNGIYESTFDLFVKKK